MRPGYLIRTLGCRSNRFDSAVLARTLEEAGFAPAGAGRPAALVLVNTCTVTHRADRDSLAWLRRLRREQPRARLVAAGCLAQLEPERLAGLPGIDLVLGRTGWAGLAELLRTGSAPTPAPGAEPFADFGPAPLSQPTRALLKVQDGCDGACAYCRVRLARGRSRSLPLARAEEAAGELARAGFQEIVLTGIHLGSYGRDLEPGLNLAGLVRRLLASPQGPRLRLSSLEPGEAGPELLAALAGSERFCPHLHLPLQSGSPGLLEAMNRPYTPQEYADQVSAVLARLPGAAVGADVMVGFPGEGEADFQATWRLIQSLDLAYLHVFPYSPRPGTPAARRGQAVDPASIKSRARELKRLDERKRRAFRAKAIGRRTEIVVESRRDPGTGLLTGVSPDYLRLLLDGPDSLMGNLVPVVIEAERSGRLLARLAD